MFRLGASDATQSAIIVFENAGDSVDFRTVAGGGVSDGTLRTTLGFDAALYTICVEGYSLSVPSEATFNRVKVK